MPALMWLLNTVSRCASLYHSDRLSDTDLKPPHARCVMAVCRHPGFSQDQLARHLCLDKSQIARHLAYLEEHGYVTRSPGADKRVLLVYPTPKAEQILPAIREVFRDWNEWLIAGFTPEEQELFSSLMERAKDRAVSYVQGGEDLPPKGKGDEK